MEVGEEQGEDARQRSQGEPAEAALGCLTFGPLSEDFGMVAAREGDLADALLDLPRDVAENPSADVAGDVDAAGGTLAFDRIRRGHDGEVGNIGKSDMTAAGVSISSSRRVV